MHALLCEILAFMRQRRYKRSRTDERVTVVDEPLLSQEDQPLICRSTCQIAPSILAYGSSSPRLVLKWLKRRLLTEADRHVRLSCSIVMANLVQ